MRIDDDTFFFYGKEDMEYFKEEYKKYVNMPIYVTGGQPMVIKEELLRPMVEAGMTKLRMGIETGAKRLQELYQRRISNEKVLEACRVINKFKNLEVTYDFILDNPWETEQESIDTIKLILDIPFPYTLSLFSLTFYPNTDIHLKAIEDGIVTKDDETIGKHYYSVKNTYLNLVYYICEKRWIPKSFKLWLLKDNVRNSGYKPLIMAFLKISRRLSDSTSLMKYLWKYIRELDYKRVKFSIKKYLNDRKYYYSIKSKVLGS